MTKTNKKESSIETIGTKLSSAFGLAQIHVTTALLMTTLGILIMSDKTVRFLWADKKMPIGKMFRMTLPSLTEVKDLVKGDIQAFLSLVQGAKEGSMLVGLSGPNVKELVLTDYIKAVANRLSEITTKEDLFGGTIAPAFSAVFEHKYFLRMAGTERFVELPADVKDAKLSDNGEYIIYASGCKVYTLRVVEAVKKDWVKRRLIHTAAAPVLSLDRIKHVGEHNNQTIVTTSNSAYYLGIRTTKIKDTVPFSKETEKTTKAVLSTGLGIVAISEDDTVQVTPEKKAAAGGGI